MRQIMSDKVLVSHLSFLWLPAEVTRESNSNRLFRLAALILLSICLFNQRTCSQISPPGLSNTKLVVWGAVGFNQHLGKHWTATTYLGVSRQSDPDSWRFLHKQAISVINQEFLYQFNNHWQLSMAGSFRRQEEYQAEAPYQAEEPSFRYEIRYYSRLYYRHQAGKLSFT